MLSPPFRSDLTHSLYVSFIWKVSTSLLEFPECLPRSQKHNWRSLRLFLLILAKLSYPKEVNQDFIGHVPFQSVSKERFYQQLLMPLSLGSTCKRAAAGRP
jgi:hypothetical protein